jgi:hypothetical protein
MPMAQSSLIRIPLSDNVSMGCPMPIRSPSPGSYARREFYGAGKRNFVAVGFETLGEPLSHVAP